MVRLPVEMSVWGLTKLLVLFGVKLDDWGIGEARTVEHLFTEIELGESFLRIGNSEKLERVLSIVKMIIVDPQKGTLLEDYQILPDGTRRDRRRSPSGKISVKETPAVALVREMNEELNLKKEDYSAIFDETRVEEKPSRAYPDLRSIYEIHPVRITLNPHVDINDGYTTIDKEDGKKLFFCWQKPITQS